MQRELGEQVVSGGNDFLASGAAPAEAKDRTGSGRVRWGPDMYFLTSPLQQASHRFRAFSECLLNVSCYDSCITSPRIVPPPPPRTPWPLFISYKALKKSNSEEVRLHSEEMGKLKWGWD